MFRLPVTSDSVAKKSHGESDMTFSNWYMGIPRRRGHRKSTFRSRSRRSGQFEEFDVFEYFSEEVEGCAVDIFIRVFLEIITERLGNDI